MIPVEWSNTANQTTARKIVAEWQNREKCEHAKQSLAPEPDGELSQTTALVLRTIIIYRQHKRRKQTLRYKDMAHVAI